MNEQEREAYRRELLTQYGEKIDRRLQGIDYRGQKREKLVAGGSIHEQTEDKHSELATVHNDDDGVCISSDNHNNCKKKSKCMRMQRENFEKLLGAVTVIGLIVYFAVSLLTR